MAQTPEEKRAYQQAYRERNREKLRQQKQEYQKGYYAKNRERILARTKAWAQANPEKTRAATAKWRQANPDKERAKQKLYSSSENGRAKKLEWQRANRDKMRAKAQRYIRRHPERIRDFSRRQLLKKHGLTPESYSRMVQEQAGRCAICGEMPSQLVVDHDHSIGIVRELLCNACNQTMGLVRENPTILYAMIQYLERHARAESPQLKLSLVI